MTVLDKNRIHFEYIRSDTSQVDYSFDLIKDTHGPF